MKRKELFLVCIMAVGLASCGQLDESDKPVSQVDTKSAVTTTTAAETTVVSATTTETEAGEEFVSWDDEIEFDSLDEMLGQIRNDHGDDFILPEYDEDKYEFKSGKYYKISGIYDLIFEDDKGNKVLFNAQAGYERKVKPDLETLENEMKLDVPETYDVIPCEELNGCFCEVDPWSDDCDGQYYFVGLTEDGSRYYFEYYGKNTAKTPEEITSVMKDFKIEK